MLTPTFNAELLNAIEVLKQTWRRRINTSRRPLGHSDAGHRLQATLCRTNQVSTVIEQTSRIKIVAGQLQNWLMNCCCDGAKCFLIRLKQKKPYPFAERGCGANRAATHKPASEANNRCAHRRFDDAHFGANSNATLSALFAANNCAASAPGSI